MSMAVAMALKPFFLFIILAVFGVPIVYAVKRWMPDSKLKRLLLDRDLEKRYPGLPYFIGGLSFILIMVFLGRG